MTALPVPGYPGRLWTYLREMYPLEQRVPGAVLLAIAVAMMFRRIHGLGGGLGLGTAHAAWNALLFMLILRLMDELKDKEVDLALFRERPLPSGRIHEADIVFTLWIAIALFLAPNLAFVTLAIAAVVLLGWALLMFRWFFIPGIMRPNLPLTLVTHNPIVPLMLLNLVVVVATGDHVRLSQVRWGPTALFVAMIWAPSFAWEIARKIRSAEEENAYVTYSRLLGRGGAVALAATAQTASLVIGLWLWCSIGLHWVFAALLGGAWASVMWLNVRFLFAPSPATSKLRRPAEGHALAVLLATIAGCWLEA